MRPRIYALFSGLVLIGSFVSILYYIVDIVGGSISWLFLIVVAALVLGTAFARLLAPRFSMGFGIGLLGLGASVYIVLVPEHHDTVATIGFLVNLTEYLTGISVLYFLRVEVWAIAIAPGPVFLTWYLLLRRRYDLAAVVGGLMLGFFILTGDASWTTTLIGSMSVFGILGFGALEKAGGSWEHIKQLGDVFVVSVLASQIFQNTIWGTTESATSPSGEPSTADATITTTGEYVTASENITLSPQVLFVVTADIKAYWHVDSYDRYTGNRWIRPGEWVKYETSLQPPDGKTTTVQQTVRAVVSSEFTQEGFLLHVMPTAWKPVRVLEGAEFTAVSSTGGFVPTRGLDDGDEYTVVSEVLDTTPTRLRNAEATYPPQLRNRYLQVPKSTPGRVKRKAREIGGDAATPYDAARAIEQWLEANKEYSWGVDRPNGDLADAFLFSMERGYCVHYATAMTVMLRMLGIPARFATGYTPGQQVAEDRWVVRGFDSHAWVEVYFPDIGWITFDPTPSGPRRAAESERLEEARTEGLPGIDTSETRSDTFSPDASTDVPVLTEPEQARTIQPDRATDAVAETTSTPSDSNGPFGRGNTTGLLSRINRTDRVTLIAMVGGGVLGINRLGLVKRGYQALWFRWQPTTDSPGGDVERAFKRLEYLLAHRYRPRAAGETPRQYLASLDSPVDRRARRVVELYEQARYSGIISREEADEAIRCVDELIKGSVSNAK